MTESRPLDDERLSAYLDGELPADERASLERLLQERADYRRALDELRTLRDRIRALPSEKLDDGFADRVLRQAEIATLTGSDSKGAQEGHSRTAGRWSRGSMMSAAATLAAMIAFALVLPNYRTKSPSVAMTSSDDEGGRDTAGGGDTAVKPGVGPSEEDGQGAGDESAALMAAERTETPSSWEADGLGGIGTEGGDEKAPMMDAVASEVARRSPEFARSPSRTRATAARASNDAAPMAAADAPVDSMQPTGSMALISVQDQQLQQLAKQARRLLNDVEPQSAVSDRWDVVLMAELRDETDWSGLEASLAASSMSVSSISPGERRLSGELSAAMDVSAAQSEPMADEVEPLMNAGTKNQQLSSFAIRQDASEFMSKLQQARFRGDRRDVEHAKSAVTPGSGLESNDVETHLLYVEGTRAQIDRFVSSLSRSQSSAVVSIAQHDIEDRVWDADDRIVVPPPKLPSRDLALRKSAAKGSGRAVHLGQSPIKRSMSMRQGYRGVGGGHGGEDLATLQQQRLLLSSSGKEEQKPIDLAESDVESNENDTSSADEPFVQGLIILQDLSPAASTPRDSLTPDSP